MQAHRFASNDYWVATEEDLEHATGDEEELEDRGEHTLSKKAAPDQDAALKNPKVPVLFTELAPHHLIHPIICSTIASQKWHDNPGLPVLLLPSLSRRSRD